MERADSHTAFAKMLVDYREREGVDALTHRAKQVQQVLEMPGFQFMLDMLDARQREVLARLLPTGDSPPKAADHLAQSMGFAGGLRAARELAQTIVVKAEESERERAAEAAKQPAPAAAGA